MLCVSIGAWATPTVSTSTWMQNNSAYETQTVASIWIENPGELAAALSQVGVDFQYLHLSAFISSNTTLELSAEDIAALNALDVKTIEMNHVYAPYFEFDNPNAEYIILPYNWTKAQVKAVGETHKTHPNFKACLSTSGTEGSGDATLIAYLNEAGTMRDAILHSYFDTRDYKTLGDGNGDCSRVHTLIAMGNICAKDISRAGVYDANGHYVINGEADENSTAWNTNTAGGKLYDDAGATDGAIVGNYALEVIDLSEAYVPEEYCTDIVVGYNGIPATKIREVWMPTDPRFKTIPADYLNINSNYIKQICIPGNIEYIKTRAFAGSGTDINYIWTTGPDANTKYDNGAYFVTSGSDEPVLKYKDNPDPTDPENHDWEEGDDNNFTYGTITLPANLKLIERHAFASSIHVRDLYVLNETAPECHVDAFNSVMYHADNTLQASSIKKEDGVKIITRDAYSLSGYKMMTMLHYPRTTATPNTQRYTDPSREYNISTGERDGNGNMLYFPTHTEFATAHDQGTYGYLWNGWNIERTWYNNEITLGTAGGYYGSISASSGHDTGNGQQRANQFYINNNNTEIDKTKCSFYDVTLGDDNQPGGYTKPAGLQDYWTLERGGNQLYPQMETTSTTEIIGQRQAVDENGNPRFEPGDCEYVKDYRYVKDDEGGFVQVATVTGYEGTQSSVDGVSTYYSDNQGSNTATPKVQDGYYVEDGTKPVFSDQASNLADRSYEGQYYSSKDVSSAVTPVLSQSYYYATGNQVPETNTTNKPISGVDTYYTDEGLTASSTPQFNNWNTYYYTTGNTVQIPTYTQTSAPVSGVTEYYDYNHNVVTPGLPTWGSFYVKNGDDYDRVYNYTPGVDYYVSYDGGNSYQTWNPQFDANYYYISAYTSGLEYIQTTEFKSGYYTYYKLNNGNYEEYTGDLFTANFYYATGAMKDEYLSTTEWDRTRTYYTNNNGTYTEVTGDMYFTQQLYKVVGEEPNYSSANGQDYNASTTYYTSNTGAEVVNPVNFDNTYYIPTYDYSYEAYTGQEGDRYKQEEYYREGTSEELADANVEKFCPVMENVYREVKGKQNDYRGWHQFVLTATAHNSKIPFEPLRSFITDNDWWTICEPYDLRYSDLIKFFGYDRAGFDKKIPYLSKLMYVVRDVENQKITLMFSKNLMEYKEVMADGEGIVHGTIDDQTKWKDAELEADPIILHKGVPYLIRPNMVAGDNGRFTRQFDIYKNQNEDLYNRLKESQEISAGKQFDMIYKGEYTVPAYVVGYDAADAVAEATVDSKTITNKDGSSFTYTPGKIKYNGKDVNYKVSDDFEYSFVGTFYKSALPQYSYFLGWDSEHNCASFWYSRILDKDGWNWNNETAIILPNFDTSLEIHQATSFDDPARWQFNPGNKEDNVQDYVKCDDFPSGSAGGAKAFTMDFGATNYNDSEATGIEEIVPATTESETISVYNVNGVFMGNSVEGLAKGIYIVNGKKYVVK